jgi:hypothetical protein
MDREGSLRVFAILLLPAIAADLFAEALSSDFSLFPP